MKHLVVLFLCFVSFLAFSSAQGTQPPVNCATLSGSCAKCMMAGCNYVWTAPGFYNSSANATCLNKAEYEKRRFNNQYTKTIWAYALPETGPLAVNSTQGQYLLSKLVSSKNYFAQPVPCYDRQLCYCKPMPPPPPSRLIVIVRDIKTGLEISLANLNTTVENGTISLTDANGKVIFDPVATSNGYLANACAKGYKCNFTITPAIGTNQTITVTIYLEPLPCILTVRTVFDADGSIASGVRLVTAGFADQTTTSTGFVTYTLTNFPAAGTVNGFLAGYVSTGAQAYACGLGDNITVTIRLIPIPNTVIVTVLDARTFEFITTALVTLTVTTFSEQSVDSTATTTFFPVAGGSYVANGRAAGYSSNSTVVPRITTNTTVHVYIYLTQLPCLLRVLVLTSQNTSKVIAGANLNLNGGAGFTRVSNAQGFTDYVLPYNNATVAFGSKSQYGSNSTSFTCGKGDNVTVIIYLPEVLTIVFAAVDAKSPGNPWINANISFNGELVPASAEDSRYHYLQVPALPLSGNVFATSAGFNEQLDTNVRFTDTRRNYTISLAPQEFTLFFTPVELIKNGPAATNFYESRLDGSGFLPNNYFDLNPAELNGETAYIPKPIQVGGSTVRNTSPQTSNAYTANVTITFIDFTTVTVLASKFDNVSPPPLDSFTISPTPISGMVANWAPVNISGNEVVINVPAFAATAERNLLTNYPYQLASGYIMIRVTARLQDARTATAFGDNDFVAATITLGKTSQFTNYNSKNIPLGGKRKCFFEFPLAFQSGVTDIQVTAPLQTYNLTASNFLNPDTGALITAKSGAAYEAYTKFTFTLGTSIFSLTSTGQQARDPKASLSITRDYALVLLPAKKRSD